jgi:hypothetical protein
VFPCLRFIAPFLSRFFQMPWHEFLFARSAMKPQLSSVVPLGGDAGRIRRTFGCVGLSAGNERDVRMKTILAMSLAVTGAALAQGGNDNGGTSDPRNRAAQMGTSGTSTQKKQQSQHVGASTLAPGQKTHWYKGQPGAYWARGHQKRVYGATSGTREITTTTRGISTLAPGHQKRLYGATSGPHEVTTETTTRHGTTSRRLPAARDDKL